MQRVTSHETRIYDLGLYDNICWNTAHGRPLYSSLYVWNELLDRDYNHLGDHFNLIFLLLAPLYYLFPSCNLLLIVQSAALALGAVPIYLLALRLANSSGWALLLAVLYLLYPPLHHINLHDFHPVALSVPALLFACYFMVSRRNKLFYASLLLAVMTKENAWAAAAMPGLYLAFCRRRWWWGIGHFIGFMLGFIVIVEMLMPALKGAETISIQYLFRYDYLGGTPVEIAVNVIRNPAVVAREVLSSANLHYLYKLLLPLGFLAGLAPGYVLLALPQLLMNLLARSPEHKVLFTQHNALLIPFIFLALIYAVRSLRRKLVFPRRDALLMIYLVGMTAFSNLVLSPLRAGPVEFPFPRGEREAYIDALAAEIPAAASLKVSNSLGAALGRRLEYKDFSFERWEATTSEFVFLDLNDRPDGEGSSAAALVLLDEGYGVQAYHHDIALLQRDVPGEPVAAREFAAAVARRVEAEPGYYLVPKNRNGEILMCYPEGVESKYAEYYLNRQRAGNYGRVIHISKPGAIQAGPGGSR